MKPLSLDVRAFRGFRAPFTLPLGGGGVVLVEGENHDAPTAFTSNGAGKSLAVVEAPMWALFDRTVRHGERAITSEVTHPERGADVSFNFSQSGVIYSATRSRSPKGSPKFTLTQDGQPYSLSKDPVTVRREVAELLGADYAVFRSAIIVQGDSLASAGFTAQMSVLETILRTYTLAKAAERASQAAIAAEKAVAGAEGQLFAARDALARAERAVQTAEHVLREQPDSRGLTAALKDADEAATALEPLRAEVTLLQQTVEAARAASHQVAQAVSEARVNAKRDEEQALQALNEAVAALKNQACPTCKRPYEGKQDRATLEQAVVDAGTFHRQKALWWQHTLRAAQDQEQQTLRGARDFEARLVTLQSKVGEAERARQRAEVLRAQIAGMEQARQVAQDALDRAQGAAHEATEAVVVAEGAVVHMKAQAGTHRFWAAGFSRTGLQADLVAAATPVLNEAAARHAQILTAGQIMVTFDPFRATNREDLVRISGASAPSYAGLSRGEKERVDLIIALSLRDLARWRLPEPVLFSVYDEVFDHCDAQGLRVIASMLQADAAMGATVIVVTHNPSFAALFPSAKILRVTKQNGEADVSFTG